MDNNGNNNLPPVVYVAESPELAINYKWYSSAAGINSEVVVLDPDKIRRKYKEVHLPKDIIPGEILIRDPFCKGYIRASNAEMEYIRLESRGIFLIAQMLGATDVKFEIEKIDSFEREITNKGEVKIKAIKSDIQSRHSEKEALHNKIIEYQSFYPQDFSQSSYEKAMSVASERGYLASDNIRSLLDARNPEIPLMKQHTLTMEMTSEVNKAMDIAFSVSSAPFLKLNNDTHIATKTRRTVIIKWFINF